MDANLAAQILTYLEGLPALRDQDKVKIEPGLTESEISELTRTHGVSFPSDLKLLLQTGLAVSPEFPDWRGAPESELRAWLAAPREGVLFDVEHNGFWHAGWGVRPGTIAEALKAGAVLLRRVPPLVPVFGHRYMPSIPMSAGNPVFSVHQADVIVYGDDLLDYFRAELGFPTGERAAPEPRYIPFWSDLAFGY